MIRVLGDRLLVALPPAEETQDEATGYTVQGLAQTASGLYIAKPTDTFNVQIATRGIVMQVGEKKGTVDLDDVRAEVNEFFLTTDFGAGINVGDALDRILMKMGPAPFEVAVGAKTMQSPTAGEQFIDDGVSYVILHESDVLGIVDPSNPSEAQ
jgi:co-chaperonin GroES (HSP10)